VTDTAQREADGVTQDYAIELKDVTKRFMSPGGKVFTALHHLDLSVKQGEFCAVVGPTGCGKSTTLGLIAGLDSPDTGEVRIMNTALHGVNTRSGYVFQSDAIFPWKTVLQNVALGLRYRGQNRKAAADAAMDWIARVGLTGFESHYPYQLSGGMRKRVALAQCLITEPTMLLMDEPFSALDVQTRTLMEDELLSIWSATSAAVLFITHDLEEAISLGDRVVVLTASPATVKRSFNIDLPRPRKASEIRFQPEFVDIYKEVWEALRDEVHISYERDLKK
jgi:NitT/TauT family transport system ATP-binding protein